MPWSSPPARIESTSITPSTVSVVRSTTSTSANSASVRASSSAPVSVTSWPAASSIDCTRDPNMRSGTSATTRATGSGSLLRPELAELLAHRFGAPPHRGDLGASAADLAHRHLAGDPGVVEQREAAVHGGGGGGVAEAVGDEQPPVPVGVRVGLRVAGDEVERRLDVAALVPHAQVQLEVGPVVGERVHDLLELVGEAHRGEAYLP